MKHCCQNCHFLIYDIPDFGLETWDKEKRKRNQPAIFQEGGYAKCYKGVWVVNDKYTREEFKKFLLKNRKNSCFFIEFYEGMKFETAEELWRIRHDNAQLKRSHSLTQIGLGIAAFALVVNVLMKFF